MVLRQKSYLLRVSALCLLPVELTILFTRVAYSKITQMFPLRSPLSHLLDFLMCVSDEERFVLDILPTSRFALHDTLQKLAPMSLYTPQMFCYGTWGGD